MKTLSILFILLASLLTPAYAQNLYFKHIGVDKNSSTSVISIYQDMQERIWFGNNNLNLYNGENVRTFRLSTYMEGVKDTNIHAICGDGKSYIYLLAENLLITYNIRTEQFTNTGIIAKALRQDNGKLYFATKNKLYRYQPATENELICALPDSTISIHSISPYANGWLLGTGKGLYLSEKKNIRCLLENFNVSCLFIDANTDLWVGSPSDGVKVYKEEKWLSYSESDPQHPLISNRIRCINQDENKNIWIGTFSGITLIDSSLKSKFHLSHNKQIPWSLRHSSIYDIYRDKQGGMWVGTYYGGISYFNPDSEHYTYYNADKNNPDQLNGFLFGEMTEDNKGNLYIATEDGGLNKIDRRTDKIKRFDTPPTKIPCTTSKAVWYDTRNDLLYIGTFLKGLLAYSPTNERFETISPDLLTNDQQRIITHLIPYKDFLIVVTQNGLYKLNLQTKTLTTLFASPALQQETEGIIQACYIDKDNQLWIASASKGILCIDPESGLQINLSALSTATQGKTIQHITGDGKGNLFFLIAGSGVLQYTTKSEQIVFYNQEQNHLLTDDSYRIALIHPDLLLLTSVRGVTLLNLQTGKSHHTLLSEASPLRSLNGNCGVYISPSDSTIFIGGVEGVIAVKEEGLLTPESAYQIEFNSLSVNNVPVYPSLQSELLKESITFTSLLTLPHDCNNLTIGFSSTNYRHTENNLFEYKLEGLDKQWTQTRHKMITYTTLSPGKYTLMVREAGDKDKKIALKIEILPPFYASVYAITLYGVLLILFLIWLIRFNRNQALLKASLEMEYREKARIEELNQMKVKFYMNVSHELRTPLTLMMSQLDLILQNHTITGNIRNKLDKIQRYTKQMQLQITEILDFRRIEQNKMPLHANQLNMVHFLKEIYSSFVDYAVSHRIHYKLETTDEEIPVWFDPMQMQKVLNNLLSNAFKFTPPDGTITIRLEQKNQKVEISISDTGCGIPQEQQEHIFDRFYQADSAFTQPLSGSGIGLSLTHEIIQQHQGSISVQSEPGKGTLFTVSLLMGEEHFTTEQKTRIPTSINTLPHQPEIKKEISEDLSEEEKQDNADERSSASILLVEDNKELLLILEEAFSLKYKVYKAHNGQEGIRLAEELQPDLIISDIMMPQLSGTAMCQQLKRKFETSHIPVVLLTARASEEQAIEGLKCGANDYIIKPFNIEMLLLKCTNIIHTGQDIKTRFHTELRTTPAELATNRIDKQLLEDSIRIIESNLEDTTFTIDTWCREIAVGRTRLSAKIKGITGLTLNDFILQIKLRKCALLLSEQELTISEIAWKSGFSSSGYMGKCFKEQFGMTPMQYRNNTDPSHQSGTTPV